MSGVEQRSSRPTTPVGDSRPTGRYLVGIDLGTTNSALAYIDLKKRVQHGRPDIRAFPVPQLVAPGQAGERTLLPSFLYLPGEHDLPAGATALPWDPTARRVVGEFARAQGSRVPGRLVTSAKSWLCHAGVDRTAPLLPFGAPPDVPRVSPVEGATAYLRHLVEAWNHAIARDRPEDRLEHQSVVLTVPASFDDVARTLTVDAARKAGLEHVTLLEEPQAAFYCWLVTSPPAEIATLRPGSRCLVVDVGGGTTDFSLIEAVEEQGGLGFVRRAVGNHLLLGGDNMDLALAKFVEGKLSGAGRLDAVQYAMLTQSCRQAKEVLLGPKSPESQTVTVMGRGRSVIGSSLHASLTPADVRQAIFEGFFPKTPRDALPVRGQRTGLHEMGLPYVSDPAITRHLAEFLVRQSGELVSGGVVSGKEVDRGTPSDHSPLTTRHSPVDAILFNGGVFQPASLRHHLLDVMKGWHEEPGQPWDPLVMTTPSLDLAVALGAAYFAWLKHTGGRRIGGGMARSYYLGIQAGPEVPAPVADTPPGETGSEWLTVLCVVPRRLEEGHEVVLDKPEMELTLGQPVSFPLFTSTVRGDDKPGDVLRVAPEQLLRLPALHTILRGGKRAGTRNVPVTLAARATEIGTLELYCVAKEGGNRWRLEFNVRELVEDEPAAGGRAGASAESGEDAGVTDVWPEAQVLAAADLIRTCYSPARAQPPASEERSLGGDEQGRGRSEIAAGRMKPQELVNALESALDAARNEWPTGLCRRLWDFLLEVADQRRLSPAHLNRWYNLAGFCLRPGFGAPLDKFRVEQLWKMIFSPVKSGTPAGAEGGAQQWIMWRRVSGGLQTSYQQALYDRVRSFLLPGRGKGGLKPGADELAEMWRMAASLERLDIKQKETMGDVLLKQVKRSPVPTYAFWALTRLGARTLLYGPLNTVLHHQTAERWLDAILSFDPGHQSETTGWGFCLSQLARRTGQRALDVDDSHRKSVLTVLRSLPVPAEWARGVEEVLERRGEEQSQMFGESLPVGLRLVAPSE
jgi:DNA-K related protein/Hsp70 protein